MSTSNQNAEALADITGTDEAEVAHAPSIKSVYVYEAPVRIWHWINALAIVVLCVTGYLIGSPLPSVMGEASDHFGMGYIRFIHFTSGLILAVGLVGRIYWALVGNHHSRELFSVPITKAAYWKEMWAMLKWYAFISPRPNRYIGHNPMARFAMFFVFFLSAVFLIFTGLAMYGEGTLDGSWANILFTSWMIPLFGNNSQNLHTYHHLAMWVMICFILFHVYAAIREDIMGRQSIVSTMISGYRTFKD